MTVASTSDTPFDPLAVNGYRWAVEHLDAPAKAVPTRDAAVDEIGNVEHLLVQLRVAYEVLAGKYRTVTTEPPLLKFSVVTDEDGDPQLLCPSCQSTGTIVEVDEAIRFNTVRWLHSGSVVADMGERGDWEFKEWFCTECEATLDAPDDFAIGDWV